MPKPTSGMSAGLACVGRRGVVLAASATVLAAAAPVRPMGSGASGSPAAPGPTPQAQPPLGEPGPGRPPGGGPTQPGPTQPGAAGTADGMLRLRPNGVAVRASLRPDRDGTVLRFEGHDQALLLPGSTVQVSLLPIAGREVLVVGQRVSDAQVLAVLAGWDGGAIRLLAAESLSWQEPDARLSLRLLAIPDGLRLRLLFAASRARRREDWTDILGWRDAAPLASEPLRPPASGTWQAGMAAIRARVRDSLVASPDTLRLSTLRSAGLLDPLG